MEENVLSRLDNLPSNTVLEILADFNTKHEKSFLFPEIGLDLKKKLVGQLFKYLNESKSDQVTFLETLRIISREKIHIRELFTREYIGILVNLAGLIAEEEEILSHCTKITDPKVIVEAQKCLCNLIYNCSFVQTVCCNNGCIEGILLRLRTYKDPNIPHDVKFFDMRMLFLLTALCAEIRPKVRSQLHGLTYLMEVLDLILKDNLDMMIQNQVPAKRKFKNSKRGRSNQSNDINYVPCLSDKEVDMACEVLKVLFNITVNVEKYNIEEEEEAHYMRLVSILHDILLSDTKSDEKKDELQSHTIDLLTNMPVSSYKELLSPALKNESENDGSYIFDGMNMETICVLLNFLDKRLQKPFKTSKETLSPILTALSESARANSTIRKFLKKEVLPPLKDVMNRPEDGTTLRNRLVKLMTSPVYDVKELVADFLFVLCKEKVNRLIKYTGYGNAAGLLAGRGLMLGGRGRSSNYSSDSEDSDTEEYLKMKDKINPVLGCYQEPTPDPLEGMSEEQKEHEAMQLVNIMDKMTKEGVIQPMRVGGDGKLQTVSHVLELQEQFSRQNLD